MKISLVIPVYNEVRILKQSVNKVKNLLDGLGRDYEIIIAEDGSTDGTDIVASRLASKTLKIKCFHSKTRKGKGKAIKDAFMRANGDILIFIDADLSTDLSHLKELIRKIEGGADVCIGSRYLKSSLIERSFIRNSLSKVYNFLVRLLFKTKITDFQCGFKAFKRQTLPILLSARNDRFFWDTEALIMAEMKGLKIQQIPIRWKENQKSKVKIFPSMINFLYNLIKLKLSFLDKKI